MANTECEKIRNLIPLYIDNMLSDGETDKVLKHLEKCPDCCNEYNYLKAIIGATKNIPQKEMPSDFHKNLMEKVSSVALLKKKRYITLRHISAGVAAAAVIAISFVALGETGEPKEMELTDQFITSRLSDEPIQKESGNDMLTDNSLEADKKNINSAESKVAEIPKNTATEEKEMQAAQQIPANISLDEETMTYKTTTVSVTEDNREAVLEILSEFEKDEIGYIIKDIKGVIEKLKETGASIMISDDDTKTQSYIIVK